MESDYSDDDDYLPITVGAWGDQAHQQQQQQQHDDDDNEDADYTTSTPHDPTKIDTDAWARMIDPEAKKRAGAIGSGGLHRQGKNYKPISEEHIIKQRKGVVIPKSSKGTKKTRAPRSNSKQAPPVSSTYNRKFSHKSNTNTSTMATTFSKPKKHQQSTPAQLPPPPPLSTIRRPPPPSSSSSSSSGQSGWGAQPLVETPFWEKKDGASPPPAAAAAAKTNSATLQQNRPNKNNSKHWETEAANSNTKPGFDSHQPTTTTTTTISPPPGFGPIPQRQYPVKSNNKSQPPPPPGYSYAEKPAWGTPTPRQSDNNNNNSPSRPWASNDEDKELWRRMDEGMKMNEQSTNNNSNNNNKSNCVNKKDLDWTSGWGDLSLNQKSRPRPPSQDTVGGNVGWGPLSTTKNDSWGSTPFSSSNSSSNGNKNTGQGWGTTDVASPDHSNDYDNDATQQQSPMQFLDQQMAGFTKGRFSDPHKNKYSSMPDQGNGKHLPKNYYTRNGTSRPAFMEAPVKVAQPPPSHNPVVISIHLELENGSKIPIPIRKLDRPETLALTFCQSQNISNPALIQGITNLFAQQKSTAMQRYNRS